VLKVGFTIYSNRIQDFPAVARHAESLGFERVWIGDHIVAPVDSDISLSADVHKGRARAPVVASDDRFYDLWSMLGAVAASTQRLGVCAGIAVLPLRHPLLTARAAITLATLSGGRFGLGVGPGWLKEEFDALGAAFHERGAQTDEAIAIIQQVLRGGVSDHEGPAFPFQALEMTAEPVDVPLYVGGVSKPAFKRAARVGDGWVGPKLPFEKFLEIRDQIDTFRTEMGTADRAFEYHMHMPAADGEWVSRFEDAGFEYGVAVFDDIHPEDPRETTLDVKFRCLDAAAKRMGL
jgi:probable F420-dependent oxidoreductase